MYSKNLKGRIRNQIQNLIKNEEVVNISEISREHGISWTTVSKWIKDEGIVIPENLKSVSGKEIKKNSDDKGKGFSIISRDEMKREEKQETSNPNITIREIVSTPKFVNYTTSGCISATLISNRHEMGDDNRIAIYNGPLASDKIHDYTYLNNTAKKFIMDQVINKGATKLKVYTTGLVQANAAVITAAMDCGIALSFMNYDNASYQYKEQVIIPSKDGNDENESSLLWIYANSKRDYKIQLVNSSSSDYINAQSIYVVKIDDIQNGRKGLHIYICKSVQDMFLIYQREVEKYLTCKELSLRVLAEEIMWGTTNSEYKFGHSFGSFQNQLSN